MRSPDGKIFDVNNPPPPAPNTDGPRLAKWPAEVFRQLRADFMRDADAASNSNEELEELAKRGQELLAEVEGDRELSSRLAKIYLDLGTLQQRQKNISKAAASFAYMLTLDPARAEYRVRRANFNAMIGFYENALADIGEAIKLRPDNAEFYWIKGIISGMASGPENKRGFLDEAINAFSTAVSKNSQESKYLISRASVYAQMKDWEKSLRDVDSAIALAPDNADLMAQRARIERQAM
jgi:tetratricopeptide (TPR) repeat protein